MKRRHFTCRRCGKDIVEYVEIKEAKHTCKGKANQPLTADDKEKEDGGKDPRD
jgi:hypothetical protein